MRAPSAVLATVCGRGGSKGFPGKNVRRLLGKPLLQYTLECAAATPVIGRIAISTDAEEILSCALELGYPTTYRRPSQFATDGAAKIDAIRHLVEHVEATTDFRPDIIVDLDIGVPLRRPADVEAAIEVLHSDPTLDAVVTVYPAERNPYFNMVERKPDGGYGLVRVPNPPVVRRQDAPQVFSITPAVFAWRRTALHVTHLFTGRWGVSVMPIERAIDIDTEHEFRLVEFLMTRENER